MFPPLQKTRMLTPSPAELRWDALRSILVFFAVYGLSAFGRSLVSNAVYKLWPQSNATVRLLISLFATLATVAAVLAWCLLVERRRPLGLGFVRRGALTDYAIGVAGGVALFAAAVGLCSLFGFAEVSLTTAAPSWWLLSLFLVGFLIQGLSEELLCRSLLMVSLSRSWPLWLCTLVNAAAFAFLHLFNPGISLLALLNIFLFGCLASILMLRRGSVWMVAALHSLWNFAQGNLFGLPVSGILGSPAPLSTTVSADTTLARLIGGGTFGIEGGLSATMVMLVGIVIALCLPTKKSETSAP